MLQEYSLKTSNLQYFSRRFGRFPQSISTLRKSCTQSCTHCYWMIPNPKLILVESHDVPCLYFWNNILYI